jgi:hypothetical protein
MKIPGTSSPMFMLSFKVSGTILNWMAPYEVITTLPPLGNLILLDRSLSENCDSDFKRIGFLQDDPLSLYSPELSSYCKFVIEAYSRTSYSFTK